MKKILSVIAAAALLTTIAVSGLATSAEEEAVPVMTAKPMGLLAYDGEGDNPYAVGNDIMDTGAVSTLEGTGLTAESVAGPTGLTGLPAVEVGLPEAVTDNATLGGPKPVVFHPQVALDGTGILFYVKLPAAASTIALNFSLKYDEGSGWPQIGGGKPFYTLAKGTRNWTVMKATGNAIMPLGKGFEGYIQIPLSSISANLNNGTITKTTVVKEITIRLDTFGGDVGSAVYGEFMVTTNDVYTTAVQLDGETEAKALFTNAAPPAPLTYMTARPIPYPRGLAVGDAMDESQAGHSEGSTLTVVASPSGITVSPAVSLNTEEVVTDGNMTLTMNAAVSGGKGLLFYVKMPAECESFFLNFKITQDGENAWPRPAADTAYSVLEKGTASWSAKKTPADGTFKLGKGFEGYVLLPFTGVNKTPAGAYTMTDTSILADLVFKPASIGGSGGAFVVGAPMIVTNDKTTGTAVQLDGDAIARDLFTGDEYQEPTPPVGGDIEGVSSIKSVPYLPEGTAVGDDLGANVAQRHAYSGAVEADISLKAIASPVGLVTTPAIELNYPSETKNTGMGEDNSTVAITWHPNLSLEGGSALVFYIKLPESSDGNGILFNFKVSGEGGNSWPRPKGSSPLYALKKGSNKWESLMTSGEGTIKFAGGFEGYIRLPYTSVNLAAGNAFVLKETDTIQDFVIRPMVFGGDTGSFVVGPLFLATNDLMTNDGVVLDKSGKIQNLFTGAQMTEDDLIPAPPTPGDTTADLPAATTELLVNTPTGENLTSTSAKLSWDAYSDAAGYRVDLYEGSYSEGGLMYKFVSSKASTAASCELTGLTPFMRYYAVVHALDAKGRILATYESVTFSPEDGQGGGDDETTTTAGGSDSTTDAQGGDEGTTTAAGNGNGGGQDDGDSTKTGDAGVPVAILCAALLAGGVLLGLRRRG